MSTSLALLFGRFDEWTEILLLFWILILAQSTGVQLLFRFALTQFRTAEHVVANLTRQVKIDDLI